MRTFLTRLTVFFGPIVVVFFACAPALLGPNLGLSTTWTVIAQLVWFAVILGVLAGVGRGH